MAKIHEAIADIAYLAGHYGYYSGDSRRDMATFVYLATQFEKKYKHVDWDNSPDLDYIGEIEKFAMKELKLKRKLDLSYPEAFSWGKGWDNLEMSRVREDEAGMYPVDDDDDVEPNDFWSVYAHQVDGGRMCVADVPTQEDAAALVDTITRAVKTFKDNGYMKMYDNKHLQEEINKLITATLEGVSPKNVYYYDLMQLRKDIEDLFI